MRRVLLPVGIAAAVLLATGLLRDHHAAEVAAPHAQPAAVDEEANPMWANAACCVCHIPFAKEELSKVHVAAKVACYECHGLSAGHANDEDVGATPPDVVFPRDRIDASCRKCHESHDAAAGDVVARFLQRRLAPKPPPVCTDCHGRHRIEHEDKKP